MRHQASDSGALSLRPLPCVIPLARLGRSCASREVRALSIATPRSGRADVAFRFFYAIAAEIYVRKLRLASNQRGFTNGQWSAVSVWRGMYSGSSASFRLATELCVSNRADDLARQSGLHSMITCKGKAKCLRSKKLSLYDQSAHTPADCDERRPRSPWARGGDPK